MGTPIKNTKNIQCNMFNADIIFCYGRKAYSKVMYAITGTEHDISIDGECTWVGNKEAGRTRYVIGVRKPTKVYSLLGIKALWVHELSHLVSMVMERFRITDDEFRSNMLDYLYMEAIIFVDKAYNKKEGKIK